MHNQHNTIIPSLTERAWFPRLEEEHAHSIDALELAEQAYQQQTRTIREKEVPPPIGSVAFINSNRKKMNADKRGSDDDADDDDDVEEDIDIDSADYSQSHSQGVVDIESSLDVGTSASAIGGDRAMDMDDDNDDDVMNMSAMSDSVSFRS